MNQKKQFNYLLKDWNLNCPPSHVLVRGHVGWFPHHLHSQSQFSWCFLWYKIPTTLLHDEVFWHKLKKGHANSASLCPHEGAFLRLMAPSLGLYYGLKKATFITFIALLFYWMNVNYAWHLLIELRLYISCYLLM